MVESIETQPLLTIGKQLLSRLYKYVGVTSALPGQFEPSVLRDLYLVIMATRLYHIYHSYFRYDYNVTSADKAPLYHADNSSWTPKKPDLTLHAGTDNYAPIVAVCKFIHFSRHCKIGLGNPEDLNNILWEDLLSQGYTHGKYRWQMPVRGGASERRSYVWKRTTSVGVNNSSPSKISADNYKLVDEKTEQVVAVYSSSSHKSVSKSGKLEVLVDHGQDFDVVVLITALAVIEKHRRRNQSSAAADGAGGGC